MKATAVPKQKCFLSISLFNDHATLLMQTDITTAPFYRWRNWGQKRKWFTLNYFYFFQAEMGFDFWLHIKLKKGRVITVSATVPVTEINTLRFKCSPPPPLCISWGQQGLRGCPGSDSASRTAGSDQHSSHQRLDPSPVPPPPCPDVLGYLLPTCNDSDLLLKIHILQ